MYTPKRSQGATKTLDINDALLTDDQIALILFYVHISWTFGHQPSLNASPMKQAQYPVTANNQTELLLSEHPE